MSIFVENESYRPFSYPWAVEAEKRHRVDMHWHEGQIEFQDDLRQYTSKDGLATKDVSHEANKNMLDKLIMVFTEMDVAVGSGYAQLLAHVKNNEIRTMWFTFAAREVTHQRAYALAAETFGASDSDWKEFRKYTEMQEKIDLFTKDCGDLKDPLNFCKFLAVVFLGEGIALFGAFACLLNLQRFGLMLNFNVINAWSLAEEQEHVKNNIKAFLEAKTDLAEIEQLELDKFVKELVEAYVTAEHSFFDIVFEMGDQQDMTKEDGKDYINYLGEFREYQLGMRSASDVRRNPLKWMDYLLSGSSHSSFFETRVTDYSHGGLVGDVDYTKYLSMIR